jgi:hypothetical protein
MSPTCAECGFTYREHHGGDVQNHTRMHDKALKGTKTVLPDGFHAITHQSPIALQKLVESAAKAASYETGYDFPSFYAAKKRIDEFQTIAIICVRGKRVVGLLVSRLRDCKYKARLDSFQQSDLNLWLPTALSQIEIHKRRTFEMIWVLKNQRRQGIAQGLIKSLTEKCKTTMEEIAHMAPFSEDALKLWQGMKLCTIYVV